MPAGLTRSETKRDVHETTTCCACSEYPKYVLPEGESDDIQIPISNCTRQIWDHKVVPRKTRSTCARTCRWRPGHGRATNTCILWYTTKYMRPPRGYSNNTQQIHARRETRARFDPNSLETNTWIRMSNHVTLDDVTHTQRPLFTVHEISVNVNMCFQRLNYMLSRFARSDLDFPNLGIRKLCHANGSSTWSCGSHNGLDAV